MHGGDTKERKRIGVIIREVEGDPQIPDLKVAYSLEMRIGYVGLSLLRHLLAISRY